MKVGPESPVKGSKFEYKVSTLIFLSIYVDCCTVFQSFERDMTVNRTISGSCRVPVTSHFLMSQQWRYRD